MIGLLKKIYYHDQVGKPLRLFYYFIKDNFVSDKVYITNIYKKSFGKKPNLSNPQTLNEKIIWLKLNERTPLHTQCADKYAVREYISEKIGDEYLVPLLYHTKDPKEIIPKNFPNPPYIIKTNHDSGGGIIVKDISKVDWQDVQMNMAHRLAKNYYKTSKEWQYKNIVPRVLVEKLLQDADGNIPFDYKIHCFNGKVNMIQVDLGRDTPNHYRNWYSREWKREPYRWSSKKDGGKFTDPSSDDVPKPKTLDRMIALSETLASAFNYVRVDWYDVNDKLFFGELTFHHDGGYRPILPEKWDYILGERLNITQLTNNA